MKKRLLVAGSVVVAALASPALAQPKISSSVQKAAATEKISAEGLSLHQALAKPDATTVVFKDGKETTVAEIRRTVASRNKLVASKPPLGPLAGRILVRRPDAAVRLKALSLLLAGESAAAQAAHKAPRGASDARRAAAMNMKSLDGILQVNHKTVGWIVTPGGYVTIDGQGFGESLGEVNVFGQFPSGPQALRPIDWQSDQIYAQLPLGLRGVVDQDIHLQVVTAARKTYRLDGGKFYATRGEEFVVTDQVHRLMKLRAGEWVAPMDDRGLVDRWTAGTNLDCPSPSFDVLEALDPGRGFTVTGLGARFGRTDSGPGDLNGEGGSRTFFPGYSLGDWVGDDIRIRWGVWRSHTAPSFGGIVTGVDVCRSSYQIEVSVQGPLGVAF